MGFKLGAEKGNYAISGEIKTKMRFHQEAGGDASVPGTPVIRKNLEPGVMGEANMDGSIYISKKLKPGSFEENQVVSHEMRHATDMRTGKLAYGDDFVKYNGETYPRENRDGKDMIKINGKWTEAGGNFPWEKDANYGNI
tara:strand:- start:1302 stop:1721 length:420 start_codon:yes stop_codon:yes gene_type:complete